MNKKDIRLMGDASERETKRCAEPDGRLEEALGQLLDSDDEWESEDTMRVGPMGSVNYAKGESLKSKQDQIEALLERMVFSERAFLKYPN